LLAPPGVFLYEWQDGSTNNTFLVEDEGLYWVEVTDFQGCRTRDTIIIETSPRPETPAINGPNELCEGENLSLNMSPTVQGAQYRWFGPNNTVFTGQTLNLGGLNASQSGTYYGFYIVAGCESFSDSIEILIKPSPEVYLGLNDTICGNTPIVLDPNSGLGNTYVWQDNSTDSTFTVTSSGVYFVTVRNDIGCQRSDTVSITFTPFPENPVIVGQSVVCDGGEIALSIDAQPGVTYTWSGPLGFSATGASVNISPIDDSNSGNYTVVANIGNCLSEIITTGISVNPNPSVTLPADQFICQDSLFTLDAGEGFFNYQWSNDQNTQTITVGPGTYSVTVGTIAGCTDSDTITITASGPIALFSSTPENTAQPGVSIAFNNQSQAGNTPINNWAWDFGGQGNSAINNPSFAFNAPGTYEVSLTVADANGCTDTYSQQYLIAGQFAIPNSFTPNGDGFNDLFVIAGLEAFPNAKISIYNRWGNVVFSTTAYQNDWAATDQPDGVYFYILELSNGETFNGDVTVMRK
jgi:gliding motility-associated-like protein